MSDLQIALIAIGALIIIAVLIINWWQERRFHRQVESSFSPLRSDALLDDPSLDASSLYDMADNHATDHFSMGGELVDSPLSENDIPELSVKAPASILPKSDDRFVKLSQSYGGSETADNDVTIPEETTLGHAYDELLYAKLERQHTSYEEIDNGANALQSNDLKEIFDAAVHLPVEVDSTVDIEKPALLEPTVSLPEILHGQIDLTALLYLAAETSVSSLNNAMTGLFNDFDKPVFVHILDAHKQWHLLAELASSPEALNRQVSRVACSMQLADRGGAVTRNTLNRFQLAIETFGLDINGHVEWQGSGDALANANHLDAFCIEVDKTLGFHLVHGENGAFTGTKLRGLAEAQGLTLNADGSFKYLDEAAVKPLFVMFNRDDHAFSAEMLRSSVVKGVTFQLDIPHVKQCAEAFNLMLKVARQMEVGLNAVLADDNNKVLGDMQIERIRQQLKVIQATMLVRGIVPGSDSAHRLFS